MLTRMLTMSRIKKDRIIIDVLRNSERKAEWLGNDNRKTMLKLKTTDQILSFKKRHGFAQSSSSAWLCVVCVCSVVPRPLWFVI